MATIDVNNWWICYHGFAYLTVVNSLKKHSYGGIHGIQSTKKAHVWYVSLAVWPASHREQEKGTLPLPKSPFLKVKVSHYVPIRIYICDGLLFVCSSFYIGRNKEHFRALPICQLCLTYEDLIWLVGSRIEFGVSTRNVFGSSRPISKFCVKYSLSCKGVTRLSYSTP